MSRAFVKEPDGDDRVNALPERVHNDLPNYITPKGLSDLEKKARQLETNIATSKTDQSIGARSRAELAKRNLRYLRERVRRAISTEPPKSPTSVQFGVTVKLLANDDSTYQFTLVGEDETDIETGHISWASPIGRLLVGRKIGDELIWPRGDINLKVEIIGLWSPHKNRIRHPQ